MILPPTGKVTGTTITTEGVITVPPVPAPGVPVTYIGYTIHNQSTSDIVVMASDREKQIVVQKGSGTTFTPYTNEPTTAQNWSWTYASERAPRPRQGFPYLSSHKLFVKTYRLLVNGTPTSGNSDSPMTVVSPETSPTYRVTRQRRRIISRLHYQHCRR